MLDLSRQYEPLYRELLEAIEEVLRSQQFILGQPAESFEQAAAAALGVKHAVGCSSGTDALWLALAAAGVGHKRANASNELTHQSSKLANASSKLTNPSSGSVAVVTTPFSFFASVSSILRVGAVPLLADIDASTFNLSPVAVEGVLNGPSGDQVVAILPVHLYGQCADWDAFERIAKERKLTLIEDAAQAWGASWTSPNGQRRFAGSLGDAAAFSFYPTKNLSAAGDAGLVTTQRDDLDERLRMLRQHGMRRRYHHDEVGWNTRLDGIQAAILHIKLKYIAGWTDARRQVAERYNTLFRQAGLADPGPYPDHGVVLPTTDPRATPVWHQYVIRTARRDELRAFLAERSIGTEIYYPIPLHRLDALSSLEYGAGSFPVAERAATEVLALPIFAELREDEQQTVVAAIADFLS